LCAASSPSAAHGQDQRHLICPHRANHPSQKEIVRGRSPSYKKREVSRDEEVQNGVPVPTKTSYPCSVLKSLPVSNCAYGLHPAEYGVHGRTETSELEVRMSGSTHRTLTICFEIVYYRLLKLPFMSKKSTESF